MGNILQITCDGAVFNRCLDCFLGRAAYIKNLQENVADLETELGKLIEAKDDVMTKVVNAERQPMMIRLKKVQGWISRVEAAKSEADELIRQGSQEIEKLCLRGYCSKNCKSSYEFGKQVARKLRDVKTLMAEGAFEVVAEKVPQPAVDERPTYPTAVGLQSQLEQVWKCLVEDSAGIIGLYGMGGVGKTTLLTHINNKFLRSPTDFDCVIWVVVSKDLQTAKVVVSKDLQTEKVQEIIRKKIGLFDGSWKNKSLDEKALDIFRILKEKKFVLLLDDIWQRVDLTKVGVPLPGPQNNASKVVFTTRSEEVCGLMEAHKKFKVECLSDDDAWELFRCKVGEETLNCHPKILELAQTSSSQFPGLGNEVYPLLKFSYDSLPNDTIRSCLLYCSLYPEDCHIPKENLIGCWIGEGFLNESGHFGVQKEGYHIVGILVHACLLEEVEEDNIKMHDVIRDMALWIASDVEKEKENHLVYAGAGLTKAPDVREWEQVRRLSLMENQIENLSEVPTCPQLLTLFLNNNRLQMITNVFFQFMPSLKVLSLSHNGVLAKLPLGILKLVSLQHLDLSHTEITELPEELEALVNLKCLYLEHTGKLIKIPRQLISKLSRLRVLRMFGAGYYVSDQVQEDSVLFGGGEVLVEELLDLEHLEVLSLTLRSCHAFQCFLTSDKLRSCTQALFLQYLKHSTVLEVSALADLRNLNTLRIGECASLKELKIDYTREIQQYVFQSLNMVEILGCTNLNDLTFLAFAPNLKSIVASSCRAEEMISERNLAEVPEVMANLKPFEKLEYLELVCLINLKSIYWKPLPFPSERN